jgi:hypothetical protein
MLDNVGFDFVEILVHFSARYFLSDFCQQRREGIPKPSLNLTDILSHGPHNLLLFVGKRPQFFGKRA